jgi:hypothetical protein
MRTSSRRVTLVLAATLGAACDKSGVRNVRDVSRVTTYFVHCDSVVEHGYCYGPVHRMDTQTFTVLMSRQQVLRYTIHPFTGCLVLDPREWYCLDDKRRGVDMGGYVMHWAELDSAKVAAVSKREWCDAPREVRGRSPSLSDKLRCLYE